MLFRNQCNSDCKQTIASEFKQPIACETEARDIIPCYKKQGLLRFASFLSRLSPCHFGEPSSRDRWWRILYDDKVLFWNCAYSFQELTDILLLPMRGPLVLPPTVYACERGGHSAPVLRASAKRFLKKYQESAPDKCIYDLSQNPDHRQRTESVDGALCTLTTNCHLWQLSFLEQYNILRVYVYTLYKPLLAMMLTGTADPGYAKRSAS